MKPRVRVLTYHRVGRPRRGRYERLTVPPKRFGRQVGLLLALGYRLCDLDVVLPLAAEGRCAERRPVVLTFDDGFAELYDHLLPLVAERGIAAVVYVVTDKRAADWADWHGLEPPALLSRSQLREMAAAGIALGSHGRTHVRLTKCPPARLLDEVEGSKKALEDVLGRAVRHFCYPHGSHSDAVVDAVRRAGYETACTTERGSVWPGADVLRLPRLTIGKRMGFFRFLRRVVRGK